MKKLLAILFFLLLPVLAVFSQETDSLLLADFENQELGRGIWTASIGTGFVESKWAEDPSGETAGVLECVIDGAVGPSGGFANNILHIDVDGDTASGFVANVYLPADYPATSGGVQIFAQDRTDWNWQSTWYNASELLLEEWNRLFFDFDLRFETIENYNIRNGFFAGVEFVLPTGSTWSGSVYADNLYLLGVKGDSTQVKSSETGCPASFILDQNFPNPFNPITMIDYMLPAGTEISMNIYNTGGQLVKTLIDHEFQQAGRHTVKLDASEMGSGVYIYSLKTPGAVYSKKMLLVK